MPSKETNRKYFFNTHSKKILLNMPSKETNRKYFLMRLPGKLNIHTGHNYEASQMMDLIF